jgi:hypothetical protein
VGFEVVVQFPDAGAAVAAVVATGRVLGSPTPELARCATEMIREVLDGAQRVLGDFVERRAHPRVPASFPVTLFPLHGDGRVEPPLTGRCLDVSAGGVLVRPSERLPTTYAYLTFEGVPRAKGLAVLVQVVRVPTPEKDPVFGARFRLDLVPR